MSRLTETWRERHAPLLNVSIDRVPDAGRSAGTVVLVHGIASSVRTFDFVVPLIEDTHRVVAIDLLGFGHSPVPENAEYTLEEHVDAIAHTIQHLHLGPIVLVGHSLGTLIASRYAATHSGSVTRLILVSPPVYQSPDELGGTRGRARTSGYLAAYKYFRENEDFTVANAARVAKLLPIDHIMEITESNWVPFVKSLKNCIETQTIISDLARVQVPIDLVYGRFDEFIVPESIAILARMRGVTAHRVEANDHVIRKSMARVVAAAIDGTPGDPSDDAR